MTGTLVILRHGESTWNEQNLFTGWHDVPLTDRGKREAAQSGVTMREEGLHFDVAHTSVLTRAVVTCYMALEELGQVWLPLQRHWRLNERHYGGLQGLDKKQTAEEFGLDKVKIWRRSYDIPRPPCPADSPEHPANDRRYRLLPPDVLPATECLADVVRRVLPYWHDVIAPQLLFGEDVLVVAHGNSLRALLMHLEHVSADDIVEVNIPTGIPRRYTFDQRLEVTDVAYLGDQEAIAAKAAAVAAQAGGPATLNPEADAALDQDAAEAVDP